MIRLASGCVAFAISILLLPGMSSLQAQNDAEVAIELSGFSYSETFDLKSGEPLNLSDRQFIRLLFRSQKVSSGNFKKWSKFADEVSWPQLSDDARQYRFRAFTRELTLKRLTKISLSADVASDDLKSFYLANCVNQSGQQVLLATRSAPKKITLNQPLSQPISFSGFFYNNVAVDAQGELTKFVDEEDEDGEDEDAAESSPDDSDADAGADSGSDAAPLFIANRFAWYPATTDDALGVSQGFVMLASQGVDVGLFDFVRRQNSTPLSVVDGDAFYQVLGAVNAIGSEVELEAEGKTNESDKQSSIGFLDLMSAPKEHFGDAITISGRLRQCVSVEITDADRRAQVGLDRYYQVSLFPDLGGRDVVVHNGDKESIKLQQFPVTICFPNLPTGFTAEQLDGRKAKASGFFYRFIRYESQVSGSAGLAGQVSPLILASRVEVGSQVTTAAGVDFVMRLLLIGIILLVGGVFAFGWAKDRARRSQEKADAVPLPDRIDLSSVEDEIDD